jgi:hypothetical protein
MVHLLVFILYCIVLYSFDLCMEYGPYKNAVTLLKILYFFDICKFGFSSRFLAVVYENEVKNVLTQLFL